MATWHGRPRFLLPPISDSVFASPPISCGEGYAGEVFCFWSKLPIEYSFRRLRGLAL